MNSLIQSLRAPWTLLRIIYLVIGAMLIAQAVQSRDIPFALVGGLFLYQSIFNTGCCGVGGAVNESSAKEGPQQSLQDTDYTEIK
jgi:hypothetical protein